MPLRPLQFCIQVEKGDSNKMGKCGTVGTVDFMASAKLDTGICFHCKILASLNPDMISQTVVT